MGWFDTLISFIEKKFVTTIAKYGVEKKHILLTEFVTLSVILFLLQPAVIWMMPKVLFYILAIVSPLALLFSIWNLWQIYARSKFIKAQEKVLLEITFPHKFMKTPRAMETFLSAIHINPGESTVTGMYINGSTRPYWSLELLSKEGELHFYIWTWRKFQSIVETQFYSMYPEAKLTEVKDYMDGIVADLDKVSIWGTDYKFTKNDAYPIKSYVDWGLDKVTSSTKPENVIDPFDTILEKFASIGEGEVAVLHIMFQMTRSKTWKKEVEDEIDKIYKNRSQEITDIVDPDKVVEGWAQLRPQDYYVVNTLRHSIEKDAFDVGIRSLYIARKDAFKPAVRIGGNHVHLFRAFEVPHLNYLVGTAHWLAGYDYPWHDPRQKVQNILRRKIIDAMKRRSYFNPPYSFDPLVLTTEELATIFHLPLNLSKKQRVSPQTDTKTIPKNLPI